MIRLALHRTLLLFLLLFSLVIGGCGFLEKDDRSQAPPIAEKESAKPQSKPPQPQTQREPPEPQVRVSRATLAAVGDILLHRSVIRDAQKGDTYDFNKMFARVKPYLESADITFANQESLMGGSHLGLSGYPRFNSPLEIGDTLKWAGVDVVSMANNHVLDRGEQGILRSIGRWVELGMVYVGANKDEADRARIRTIERNGILFSFLAYTYGTNGILVPEGKSYLVNLIDRDQIAADIAKARESSDVVVVSLHFGNEYVRMPSQEQRELAQFVADQGAHVILGHHPHVLQPLEVLHSVQGHQALAIYSLGNFIAAQDKLHCQIGGILQVEVEKRESPDHTTIQIHSPAFLPTYIHFKNWKGYTIIPMDQLTDAELPNAKQHLHEIQSHLSRYIPNLQLIATKGQ